MHENFIALDSEKRDRIVNAAMREFSSKGFKNASTNEIVKKAGISKGALFHYFSTKKDLFDFLYSYSITFFMDAVRPRIKELPSDVFSRWIAFAALKMEIAAQYPDIADFMQRAYRDSGQGAGTTSKSEYERFSASVQELIYDGIDLTKFRPGTDVTKALQIIWWVIEGFAVQKMKEPFDISMIKKPDYSQILEREMEEYLSLIKKSFYKEEFWE